MSSTATAQKASQPAGTNASGNNTASKPIDILPSQLAQLYAHLHPVLLLSVLIVSFSSLVRDPVTTLLRLAPIVATLQALFCILCLPSSGRQASTAPKPGQKKKSTKPLTETWGRIVPALLSLILTTALSAPLLSTILILFGAPLTTHHAHTALLALHLAIFTTPQLYYVYGLDLGSWLRIVSLQHTLDAPYGLALGACTGAWLGAIPIPLDWDRDWQRWPVTVVAGLYGGALVGALMGGLIFKGTKLKMT